MDLTKVVQIRMFDLDSDHVYSINRTIESIVKNPETCNMVDVGFYLLNEVRKDIGLPPMDKKLISE